MPFGYCPEYIRKLRRNKKTPEESGVFESESRLVNDDVRRALLEGSGFSSEGVDASVYGARTYPSIVLVSIGSAVSGTGRGGFDGACGSTVIVIRLLRGFYVGYEKERSAADSAFFHREVAIRTSLYAVSTETRALRIERSRISLEEESEIGSGSAATVGQTVEETGIVRSGSRGSLRELASVGIEGSECGRDIVERSDAASVASAFLSSVENREKRYGEYADDRYDDHEFDESETFGVFSDDHREKERR